MVSVENSLFFRINFFFNEFNDKFEIKITKQKICLIVEKPLDFLKIRLLKKRSLLDYCVAANLEIISEIYKVDFIVQNLRNISR